MNFISNLSKNTKIVIAGAIVLIAVAGSALLVKGKEGRLEEPVQTYSYISKEENNLAEKVIEYLSQYVILSDSDSGRIADVAVQSYNTILTSGITKVTEEHTAALEKNIQYALNSCLTEEQISEEDFSALASGVSQLIWDSILSQIEVSEISAAPEYEEQYTALAESLQEQINALKEKSTHISIRAKVNSQDNDIDESFLASLFERVKGETLASANSNLADTKEEILDEVNDDIDDLKKQITTEIANKYGNIQNGKDGTNGKDGADGKNGTDGEDGKDGSAGADGKTPYIAYAEDQYGTGFSLQPTEKSKYMGICLSSAGTQPTDPVLYSNWRLYKSEDGIDGKDGADGADGKTTYIAYAEDASGNGFSLTPTESTKYIGTCISTADTQPTDVDLYGNWQEYRSYIMSTTTDENNVTTLHIR